MNKLLLATLALVTSGLSLQAMDQFLRGLETGLKISGINYTFQKTTPNNPQPAPQPSAQPKQPATFSTNYSSTPYQPRYTRPPMTSRPYMPLTPADKKEIDRRIAEAQLFNLITKKP